MYIHLVGSFQTLPGVNLLLSSTSFVLITFIESILTPEQARSPRSFEQLLYFLVQHWLWFVTTHL